jgi:serine/threonine-protein kinase
MPAVTIERLRDALAGRYVILDTLGAGGMATVFLADDPKHDRRVAIKVLKAELAAALGAERFHSEIRTTARLTHPHILPLHDSGDADGMLYYVMPFIDGETLRDRITRDGRLPVPDALRIARDVSDALAYAHARGVVHRDIKPENILLQEGHALVADFGIARALDAVGTRMTATGLLLGTPMYMSPEQATGDVLIDGRSDVYSLACVLFEMLTGEAPFAGDTLQSIIAKRFTQPAPSAMTRRSEVPERLDSALRKALARDPGDRIESATRFAEMLAVAMTAAATVAARAESPQKEEPCIAVLPFANMSSDADAEFFSDGMSEEILNALAKLSGLKVIARTSSFAFKGKNVDIREIGEKLGARHVLEGSVRKAGNRLRITAQLIDASNGVHLWSERYDREMNDVFAIQDEITEAIRDELSKRILGIGRVHKTESAPQIDAETYEMFLRGRHLVDLRVEGMKPGMMLLKQVVERAPAYAPGHAALAGAIATLTLYCAMTPKDGFPRVRAHAKQALALDPNVGRAHMLLGHVAAFFDWDWSAAAEHYDTGQRLSPDDPWCLGFPAMYWASLGDHERTIRDGIRAVEMDPLNATMLAALAVSYIVARRYDEAIVTCDRTIEISPGFSEGYRWKGAALDTLGRATEAVPILEKAAAISNRHVWALCSLARAYHHCGRVDEALELEAEVTERAGTEPVPRLALAFLAVNPDMDRAFAFLDQAIEARDFWLIMMRVEPQFDRFRNDPRFDDAIRRVGIPPLKP